MGLEVLLSISAAEGDRIEVKFHYLHSDVRSLVGCLPCPAGARGALHEAIVRRVRPLLESLDLARAAQRRYELDECGEPGAAGRLAPVLLHDACTLYAGCAADAFGGGGGWFSLGRPCGRCGANWWGLTCTPPRHGSLDRDPLDRAVGFCWACTARREIGVYEAACGWRCPGLPFRSGAPLLDAECAAVVGVV